MFIEVTKEDGTGVRLLNINHIIHVSPMSDAVTQIVIAGVKEWIEISEPYSLFKERLMQVDACR
jgi:hypothetical protein